MSPNRKRRIDKAASPRHRDIAEQERPTSQFAEKTRNRVERVPPGIGLNGEAEKHEVQENTTGH